MAKRKTQLDTIRLTCEAQLDLQAAADGADKSGPRSFKIVAYTGGPMTPGGFGEQVVVDLAGMKVPARAIPILRDHDSRQIVGHTSEITKTDKQLTLAGVVSGVNPHAAEVVASADNGFPWQASIGAHVHKLVELRAGQKATINGREVVGPLLIAKRTTLYETSFLALGADDKTSAKIAASAGSQLEVLSMDFAQWLEAKGFSGDAAETLNDAQRKGLQAAFDAEQAGIKAKADADAALEAAKSKETPTSKEPEVDPIQELRAARAAEIKRLDAIGKLCAGKHADIEAKAIEENWNETKVELEILRASRGTGPAIISRGHNEDCTVEALQGAMMLRAGMALDAKHWQTPQAVAMKVPAWLRAGLNTDKRQKAMEFAHHFSDMSMIDLCAEAIRLDGKSVPHGRADRIHAAMSGSTLTNIFSSNVNTVILATYQQSPDTTMGWTRETEVADFKTNDRTRMTKGAGLAKLPRGKTADHANRSDTKESYKIARYAKQFVVDEQDFIDDAFNALSDAPAEFGQAAARLRPDLVYAILFANAALDADAVALFHSTHANTDTSAALAAATLKTGITKIGIQAENGVTLNLMPTHLIVPMTLQFTGAELLNSAMLLQKGNTDGVFGEKNTIADKNLTLVSEGRLDNGVTDPSTGTAYSGDTGDWFLAATGAHGIEVAYLRGTGKSPQVRNFLLTQGAWGMGWDINMDIGAKALDFRGLYRGQN